MKELYDRRCFVKTGSSQIPQSIIYHPLMVDNQILGVVSIQHHAKNRLSQKDFEALKRSSDYAAIAIHNAKLFGTSGLSS